MSNDSIWGKVDRSKIPDDLIHRQFHVPGRTYPSKIALSKKQFNDDHQVFQLDLDLDPWVFLNNAVSNDEFYYVLLRLNARFSPGKIVNPLHGKTAYRGLYQAMLNIEITPDLPVEQIAWKFSSPETVNQETQKTEKASNNISLDIGYKTASAKASWTWESSSSFSVSDWNIVEKGSENKIGWQFWQKLPWDGRLGASNTDVTVLPDLSQNTAQFHAQGIWKTANKISSPVRFDYEIIHLPQMTWGYDSGLAIPVKEEPTPVINDSFALDFAKI